MQIVIDIPERDYNLAFNYPDALIATYAHYIKDGTPLPKEHGRLIDVDKIFNALRISKDIDDKPKAKFMGLLIESPSVIGAEEEEK